MSLYHYAQPAATHQFSDNTKRHAVMEGIQYPRPRCSVCKEPRPQLGGTKRNGKFVCADCRKPASVFTQMLLGTIAKPIVPARNIIKHTLECRAGQPFAGLNSTKMQEYQSAKKAIGQKLVTDGRDKVLKAIQSGVINREKIIKKTGLSRSTVAKRLTELVDMGKVQKVRLANNVWEWRQK